MPNGLKKRGKVSKNEQKPSFLYKILIEKDFFGSNFKQKLILLVIIVLLS
jgi:hypothetical protein